MSSIKTSISVEREETVREMPVEKPEFDTLVKNYEVFIRAFILKRMWDDSEVDDIYQITLLEAFKSYGNFRNESHPRTWMCGIALKVLSNHYRKKLQSRKILMEDITSVKESDFDDASHVSSYQTPEKSYEYELQLKNLSKCYQTLPETMKQVFDTVVYDGSTYEDASIQHNIPVGTVRSRISRARTILKSSAL